MGVRLHSATADWFRRARFALQLTKRSRYLFVLSHMRSYSSLLCHILNSHPEIDGYVEQHQPYMTWLDLIELQIRVAKTNGERIDGRYVLDKLLHNKSEVSEAVLRRDDLYAIFTIREPEQTIKSTIAMVRRKKHWQGDWKADPRKVARYYVRRSTQLIEMASLQPKRSLFFEADLLLDDTERVLEALGRFLELREPLRPEYETQALTGKALFGDPGVFISAGHIVRERADYDDIEVSDNDLLLAREAFHRAREALAARCDIVLG